MELTRQLLLVALLAAGASAVAGQAAGLSSWCPIGTHATSAACMKNSTCSTGDSYWSDNSVCLIPSTYGAYPYWSNVCQNDQGVVTRPVMDYYNANNQIGTLYAWRDYSDKFFITVALDGKPSYQPYLDRSLPYSMMNVTVWNGYNNNMAPVYFDTNIMSDQQRFTCVTYMVDLKQTCNPAYSTWQQHAWGGPYCQYNTNGTQVPGVDISSCSSLFVWLSLSVSNTNATTCQPAAGMQSITVVRDTFNLPVASCFGQPRPAPPPPPSPVPSPQSPPPPPPPIPQATQFSATVMVTSNNQRTYNLSQCDILKAQLSPYYANRATFSSVECQLVDYWTDSTHRSGLGLTVYYTAAGPDISFLFAALQPAAVWRNLVTAMAPGCGFTATYKDTVNSGDYSVCSYANCSNPPPTIVFNDTQCPPPGSSPAPVPPPVPGGGPSTGPVSVAIVFSFATPNSQVCPQMCDAFGASINNLVVLSNPYLQPWQCQAAGPNSMATVAIFPSTAAAQEFSSKFDINMVRVLASIYLGLDYTHLPSPVGCNCAVNVSFNTTALPALSFNSANTDVFACPLPAPNLTNSTLTVQIHSAGSAYPLPTTVCASLLSAVAIFQNSMQGTQVTCNYTCAVTDPTTAVLTLPYTNRTDSASFAAMLNQYMYMFVSSAKLPCGASVSVIVGQDAPSVTSCSAATPYMCCPTPTPTPNPQPTQLASRLVVLPPQALAGRNISTKICLEVLCPRLIAGMPVFMADHVGFPDNSRSWDMVSCEVARDPYTQRLLYYLNMVMTPAAATKTTAYLQTEDGFANLLDDATIPCYSERVTWRVAGNPNVNLNLDAIPGNDKYLTVSRLGYCAHYVGQSVNKAGEMLDENGVVVDNDGNPLKDGNGIKSESVEAKVHDVQIQDVTKTSKSGEAPFGDEIGAVKPGKAPAVPAVSPATDCPGVKQEPAPKHESKKLRKVTVGKV